MAFCSNCGGIVTKEATFCPRCGTKVEGNAAQNTNSLPTGAAPSRSSNAFKLTLLVILCIIIIFTGLIVMAGGSSANGGVVLLGGVLLLVFGIWWIRRSSPKVSAANPSALSRPMIGILVVSGLFGLVLAVYLEQHRSGVGTAADSVVQNVNAVLGTTPLPTFLNCGEPIVIEECTADSLGIASCRIRYLGPVPLSSAIGMWAYDAEGTRVGAPIVQSELNGLNPQEAMKATMVYHNHETVKTVILCSVDPNSTLGHGRFAIGQSPPLQE